MRKKNDSDGYGRDAGRDPEDDGRTVADMSEVSRGAFPGGWYPAEAESLTGSVKRMDGEEEKSPARPWEDNSLTKQERRMYVLGAMKAALLIGCVYLAGIVILIFLLLKIWGI